MKCLFVKLFLGTGHATKSDEFSERFQTAVDPQDVKAFAVPEENTNLLNRRCASDEKNRCWILWRLKKRIKMDHLLPLTSTTSTATWAMLDRRHPPWTKFSNLAELEKITFFASNFGSRIKKRYDGTTNWPCGETYWSGAHSQPETAPVRPHTKAPLISADRPAKNSDPISDKT